MNNAEKKRLAKIAQRQLNAKLRLERKLADGVRAFIKRQNEQAVRYAEQFRNRLDASINEPIIRQILKDHYTEVSNYFTPHVISEINAELSRNGIDTVDKNDPALLAALALFISSESEAGAMRFVDRSNRDIAAAFSGENTIEHAGELLDSVTIRRSQAMAAEHTQRAAEGSKAEMANAANSLVHGSLFLAGAAMEREKTWMTRMDKAVRDIHANALFQTVAAHLPFFVGGEQLMFPGDQSLGASMRNIANCRCSAIYSFRIV